MLKTTRKKSYHGYEARLETFSGARLTGSKPRSRKVTWPHARPSATKVAAAGFYFTPAPTEYGTDLVTCYMCGIGIDGWEQEDDPIKVHLEISSTCPVAIMQGKPWEQPLEYDPHSEVSVFVRLQTFYQPLTNEELESAIVDSTTDEAGNRKVLQISAASLILTGTSVWPHDSKKGWTPISEKMAKAGFYYSPNNIGEDFGLCPYCGIGLEGWEPNDDPMTEHRRMSPNCSFFENIHDLKSDENGRSTPVVVIPSDLDEGNESSASLSSVMSAKPKKKSSTAVKKRASKRTSVNSEISDSDASTNSTTKRKRGRPSRKAVAIVKEKKKARVSVFEDDSQLFTSVAPDSVSMNSTLELLSPSIVRGTQGQLSKGSVSAKISKFEGYAAEAADPSKITKTVKSAKSLNLPKIKPESNSLSRALSVNESTQTSNLFESRIPNEKSSVSRIPRSPKTLELSKQSKIEKLPVIDSQEQSIQTPKLDIPNKLPVKSKSEKAGQAGLPVKSKLQQSSITSKGRMETAYSSASDPQGPRTSYPIDSRYSKPSLSPDIFHDNEEPSIGIHTTDRKSNETQLELPKLPLHDTSSSVQNTTPPPTANISTSNVAQYGGDESKPPAPKRSVTPVQQQFSQPESPPPRRRSSHHQHHHDANKRNNCSNSSTWTAVDPDIVFDLLRRRSDCNGIDCDTDGHADVEQDIMMVHERHMDKTVQEWIDILAAEGEQRLKAKCEALVGILEAESQRAVAALEALPVMKRS